MERYNHAAAAQREGQRLVRKYRGNVETAIDHADREHRLNTAVKAYRQANFWLTVKDSLTEWRTHA